MQDFAAMSQPRPPQGSPWFVRAQRHACLPAFLAITALLTWPLLRDFGRALPTVVGLPDALFQAFVLNWDLRALATNPLHVFDAPIFYPEKNTLTYMDHLLGESAVAAPAMALTNNTAAAYNSVVFFSFVASAGATYRLARLLGASRSGGFLCGVMFGFSPFRYCNMANLNLLQTEFLPLGLFFALRFARKKRTRDLVGSGFTLAAQSYFSWYHTFYLATALGVLGLDQIARGRLRGRDLLDRRALITGLSTIVLLLPGLLPYLEQRSEMRGFGRTLGMTSYWSADL